MGPAALISRSAMCMEEGKDVGMRRAIVTWSSAGDLPVILDTGLGRLAAGAQARMHLGEFCRGESLVKISCRICTIQAPQIWMEF